MRFFNAWVRILFWVSIVGAPSTAVANKTLSVQEILTKADAVSITETTKMYIVQTVISPSGDKRTFKMVSYSKGQSEKGLTEYLSPSQVKGMKILTLNNGDDIWSYFPTTNRVRKIASSARNRKVQGSDFSYEDMATGKMSESWRGGTVKQESLNGKVCYKMKLVPTAKGPKGYKFAYVWIDKSNFTLHRVLYFDRYGEKLKQLDLTNYESVDGVKMAFLYTMVNLLDGGKTIMKVAHAQVNIKLNDALFSQSELPK